jgi:hypothetical protein
MATKTKREELEAALKGAVPTPSRPPNEAPATAAAEIAAQQTPVRRAAKKKGGKNVHFFLHDEDTRLIRELATWLSGQGERPNDSLVVRSAIRAVKTDANLLKSYRQATQLDGRLKQHKTG